MDSDILAEFPNISAGIAAVVLPLSLPLQMSLLERQNADLVRQLAENQQMVEEAAVILKDHEDRRLAEDVAQQAAVKESVAKKKKVDGAARQLASDPAWKHAPADQARLHRQLANLTKCDGTMFTIHKGFSDKVALTIAEGLNNPKNNASDIDPVVSKRGWSRNPYAEPSLGVDGQQLLEIGIVHEFCLFS